MMVNQNSPIFCSKFHNLKRLCSDLRKDLINFDFNPITNSITPEETCKNPYASLNLRLQILTKTYCNDYHTDSFDMERLKRQIEHGEEAIWFWGHEHDIEKARDLINGGSRQQQVPLGTVTVLSVGGEYGTGYGELCRSGSQTSYNALAPIMHRTIRYHCGEEHWLQNRYHTLMLVSRNRPTTDNVRGGEAIHRIHSRYVKSRFWGFAPWYVMQGSVLELLDHRHCNRDPSEVMNAIQESGVWYFAEPEYADFAETLCRLNFGISPRTVSLSVRKKLPEIQSTIHLPPSTDLFRHNHGTVIVGTGNTPLKFSLDYILSHELCCVVVRLPLDDNQYVPVQNYLTRNGFRFTSIIPPIKTWIKCGGQRKEIKTRSNGIWCRPRNDLEVVQPFYRNFQAESHDEQKLLNYLRTHLSF